MFRHYLVAGALWLASSFCVPVLAAPPSGDDRRALEQLAADNDAAWGSKDVATISTQYADAGSVRVSPQSPVIVGRQPVTGFFDEAFSRRKGTHRHITNLDHIELISPDMALADAAIRVERVEADGTWTLVRKFRSVTVAVREGRVWKLRAVRAIPLN
jgi:ketosteroid isomerase-like protein